MSRQTFVYDPAIGKLVPKGTETARRTGGLQIIRDFADYVENPADGQHYGSRRAYEQATTRAGAVEIGHAEQRKLRASWEGRGQRGIETGPSVRDTIRETFARRGE